MLKPKKFHVGELKVGMYVSQLDRDWLETPFLMQGFFIEEIADIQVIEQYCEHVWVDTARIPEKHSSSSNEPSFQGPNIQVLENSLSAVAEYKKSEKAFTQARKITKTLLDDMRLGVALDTDNVKTTVNECVQSILRNPDALMWMARIHEENEYTSEHCLNVCILAITFGRHLGMTNEELENIGLCGLLHDVGKMRVPSEILDKPGKLTEKEFTLMKSHVVHGRNLLLSSGNVAAGAVDAAYSHHERMDGKGYPRRLDATGISRVAKIISIVDAYDAMTANRCYAPAVTSTEALKRIYKGRGTQFDEKLALQFIKTIGLFPPGSVVELYNGMRGIVVETNQKRRHLPKILIAQDEQGVTLEKYNYINLVLVEDGSIPRDYLIKKVWPDGTFGLFLKAFQEQGAIFAL